MTLKKGDQVQVIAGRDKGKKGTVEKIVAATNRVVVSGINIRKRHLKPTSARPKGGIIEMPAPISRANVMIVSPSTGQPSRIKQIVVDGKKVRASVKTEEILDKI
jgi:large subunit ribosomal protein L24